MTPTRIPAALPHEALTRPNSDVALRLQQALGDEYELGELLGGGGLADAAAWEEVVVVHTALLLAALWLTSRHGALATLIALFVAYGMVRAVDLLWAGGPFTITGVAAVALLLVPAALAALAYRQRPEAKKTW